MSAEKWKVLMKIEDALQAPILQSLLEAHGFDVIVSQETFQQTYGLSLSGSQILVPNEQFDDAEKLLKEHFRGDFENIDFDSGE